MPSQGDLNLSGFPINIADSYNARFSSLYWNVTGISFRVIVRFYEGVVELSLYAALKRDPQGLALHFYRNGEPHGDAQGEEAFIAR